MQRHNFNAVLRSLAGGMRMQAHASAAVVNFSENCEQELLPPYLDNLISKLLTLLQRGQRTVQVRKTSIPTTNCDCCTQLHERILFAARQRLVQLAAWSGILACV